MSRRSVRCSLASQRHIVRYMCRCVLVCVFLSLPNKGALAKCVVQTTQRLRAHLCTDTHSCNPSNLFPSQPLAPLPKTLRYNIVTHRGAKVPEGRTKENERQREVTAIISILIK